MEIKDTTHLEQFILETFKKSKEELNTQIQELRNRGIATAELETKVAAMIRRIDEIDAMAKRPGNGSVERPKTIGELFAESEGFQQYKNRGWHKGGLQVKFDDRNFHGQVRNELGAFEEKTTIDSAALGRSTPGVLAYERVGGIIPLAERRLTIRDLIPASPTTMTGVEYIQELAFTSAASPQAESSAKAESADTFQMGSAICRTIAHWLPVSRQALDDLAELRAFIDRKLMYGLKLKEETEIISGDGLGSHLSGLTTQATAYAGTYDVGGDTKLDRLRHAIMELEAADNYVDGIILNPVDYGKIELIKDETNGANTGNYVVGDPKGSGVVRVPTLWGRPCVLSNSLTAGKFLVGSFAQFARIYDRMDAIIDVSTEHSTYFTQNLVAVRAEERLAFAVFRTSAFLYGTLP